MFRVIFAIIAFFGLCNALIIWINHPEAPDIALYNFALFGAMMLFVIGAFGAWRTMFFGLAALTWFVVHVQLNVLR